MNFSVKNEFDPLKKVVLGVADDFGGAPSIENIYDPHSRKHVLEKTFPEENKLIFELNEFKNILQKYNIDVLRPRNIKSINQIFTRDIGFVIDDVFFISNIIQERKKEIQGISHIFSSFNKNKIINLPRHVSVEGGDVIVFNNYLFIGTCNDRDFLTKKVGRTNKAGVDFLKKYFVKKKVFGFGLKKSDTVIKNNCLHLDCCFQPLGLGHVLICYDAFNNQRDLDIINKIFLKKNIIEISNDEMGELNSNLFSISKNVVVTNKKFKRINNILSKLGYLIEEIEYSNIAKMGGLLRCSTLPLVRL